MSFPNLKGGHSILGYVTHGNEKVPVYFNNIIHPSKGYYVIKNNVRRSFNFNTAELSLGRGGSFDYGTQIIGVDDSVHHLSLNNIRQLLIDFYHKNIWPEFEKTIINKKKSLGFYAFIADILPKIICGWNTNAWTICLLLDFMN